MTLRHLALVGLSAVCLGPAHVETGTIRGRVILVNSPRATDRPSVTEPPTSRQVPADRGRAVVYLDSAIRQAFDQLPVVRARMDQKGEQFVPRVLAITTGSVVDFPNSDVTFHNVFSLSATRTFDLGRYRPGRTGWVKFERAGVVSVFCDIHTHMSAFILVFNHPYFAVTDPDGRYTIANVPAGQHDLKVWSEAGSPPPRVVTVRDGEVTEVDVRVGRESR